jgi:hypothetical protein
MIMRNSGREGGNGCENQHAVKKWTRSMQGWNRMLNQMAVYFEGRLPV